MTNVQFYMGYLIILIYCLSVTTETELGKICQDGKKQSIKHEKTKLRFVSMVSY